MNKFYKISITFILFCFVSINSLLAQVKDFDNNDYDTTNIVNQNWLTKNLAVTHFRNGDEIHMATSFEDWETYNNNHQPAYMYYQFDPVYGMTYGVLYNFYAVADNRGLAPKGYHIPSTVEWQKLFINDSSINTTDLLTVNDWLELRIEERILYGDQQQQLVKEPVLYPIKATNMTRFSAIPSLGLTTNTNLNSIVHKKNTVNPPKSKSNLVKTDNVELAKLEFEVASYDNPRKTAWWSSTQFDANNAWVRYIDINHLNALKNRETKPKSDANYVRCIKD